MTLWNPLNVFSGRTDSAADGPSASFDPSRIGDPLGPRPSDPAIGTGGLQIGGPVSTGDPRRNPIGFAPAADPVGEPRFRTELSFRRHHELPRSSTTPVFPEDGAQSSWQSPEQVGSAEVDVDHVDAVDSLDAVDQLDTAEEPVTELPVAKETVPFFKREISFRKKQKDAAEEVSAQETPDDIVDESVDESLAEPIETAATDELTDARDDWTLPAIGVVAAVAEPEQHADDAVEERGNVEAGERESLVAADAVTFASDSFEADTFAADILADGADETAEKPVVPFYKREISFRRKKNVAEVAAAAEVAHAVGAEDTSDEPAEAELEHEIVGSSDEPAEIVASVDEPTEPDAFDSGANAGEEATFGEDNAAAELVASEPHSELDAPAFEIAAMHELDRSNTDDEALEELPSAGPTDNPWRSQDATREPEDDVAAFEDVASFDDVAAFEDVAPTEDVATEDDDEVPVHAAVAAAEAVDDTDVVPDLPDVAADDAPRAPGRFGSRKRKSEKAPKRQSGKGRKVVGLKIGASQLAAAIVTETDRGHELLGLARRPLAAGIVVDGEVRDESALAGAVRSFFDDEKLPKGNVRIGLSSNRIGVRTLDIEGVEDASRFDNAVRFKAHEVLPVALSESVLDYRVLEERIGEDGSRSGRVLLVVAPRDQVEPYTRVADLAGIGLEALDLEALGLLRAFVAPGSGALTPDDTASVVVSIGHESSTLLVAGGGACEFTRVFDWGGSALEEAIASSLDVRPAEAATILRHLSLSGPGRQYETLDEVTRARATDAIRQRLTPFARELVNSLQFYQTQAESLGIGGIQITGGTSHLEGIDDALHQMIGVKVSVGDPLSRVVRAEDFDPALESAIGSFGVPIGLAIDDLSMRGVNLLPKGTVVKKSRRSTLVAIGAPIAVAVPVAALAFMYLGAHGKVTDQQSQLDAARAELAALPQPTRPVIDTGVVGDEAVRATAVANVLGGRLSWEAVFRDMSKVLPANVWLSTLSLTAPEATTLADAAAAAPAPAAAGVEPVPTAVAVDGFTFTQPDVARLLARLATLPSLKRVTLTSSQSQLLGTKKVVHFAIVADLNQTGGAS